MNLKIMNKRDCPICGLKPKTKLSSTTEWEKDFWKHYSPSGKKGAVNFIRCASCNCLFQPLYPSEKQLDAIYANAGHDNTWEQDDYVIDLTNKHYLDLAMPALTSRQEILDVGCDKGLFLKICKKHFSKLTGVDPNASSIKTAKKELPDAVLIAGTASNVPKQQYDLITLIHVLDHIAKPKLFLDGLREHFSNNTVALIVVHNEQSMLAKIMGKNFPPINPQHPQLYSPTTLRKLIENSGYRVVDQGRTLNFYPLEYFIKFNPILSAKIKAGILKFFNMYFLIVGPE